MPVKWLGSTYEERRRAARPSRGMALSATSKASMAHATSPLRVSGAPPCRANRSALGEDDGDLRRRSDRSQGLLYRIDDRPRLTGCALARAKFDPLRELGRELPCEREVPEDRRDRARLGRVIQRFGHRVDEAADRAFRERRIEWALEGRKSNLRGSPDMRQLRIETTPDEQVRRPPRGHAGGEDPSSPERRNDGLERSSQKSPGDQFLAGGWVDETSAS
jgi:hypothetical protein